MKLKGSKIKKIIISIIIYSTVVFLMFSGNIFNSLNLDLNYKAPYLSITTGNASTCIGISFQTPASCNTSVYLGINNSYLDQSQTETTAASLHHFNFTGLEPDTVYHYTINSTTCNLGYMNKDFTFETAPASGDPHFSFTVIGDTRPDIFGYTAHEIVMEEMLKQDPDFMINVGDIVLNPIQEFHWKRFYDCITMNEYASTHPYMVSIGNHETIEQVIDRGVNYEKYVFYPHTEFYYAYNYSNTCFISLDLEIGSKLNTEEISQVQIDWLNDTLFNANASQDINWIIASWHVPAYSSGGDNAQIKEKIMPLLESYKVDVIFCGHHHVYERLEVNGIPHIITGGGGAELNPFTFDTSPHSIISRSVYQYCLVEINDNQFNMRVFDQNGIVFDTLNLIQDNPWRL